MGVLKNKMLIILMVSVFCFGCKTKKKPIDFVLLEIHSGKKPISFENGKRVYSYGETFLVDNLPKRQKKGELDELTYDIQKAYLKKNNKICLLEDDITYYSMSFFRKTSCTEYFIDNPQDHSGMFQTTFDDCKEDREYFFYYKRDKKNPNMWVLYQNIWGKDYRDTIYCKPNKNKQKLPVMPD